jgi:1-pyrroline-5-carboxylate dehydrogenase
MMKPSEYTSVIVAKVAEIFDEAGLPEGVLNFCPGYGGEIGDHLVTDARTRFISFTGSVESGLRIYELAARQIPEQRWIKGILVETGGKDAMIIGDSADLEAVADDIVKRAYVYAGQKCSAASRAILHRVLSGIICRSVASRNGSLETKRLCPVI